MLDWRRPETAGYPKVYKRWIGRKEVNGKKRSFWIQDLTADFFEEVVHYYITEFIKDENLCKYSNLIDDKPTVEEWADLWRRLLRQNISLICLTKDDDGQVKICGFNCIYMVSKDDKKEEFKNPITKKIVGIIEYMSSKRNVFEEYGFERYISAMGLYVLQEYRGESLGQEILDARMLLGKEIGVKGSVTFFTSFISQKLAYRAGFKDFVDMDYQQMAKERPELEIKNIHEHTKVGKLMVATY